MVTPRTILGNAAEDAVCVYLISQGFSVLARNWRRPWGELDVVARRAGVVHFVEVKASAKQSPGFEPYLRADWRKMAKVRRTAQTWLAANRYGPDTEWQLDVVSVIMSGENPRIEYFENAT